MRKLKAHALFFTLIISLIIAMTCSAVIMLAYYHRSRVLQDRLQKRLCLNAESAIRLALATDQENGVIDLYNEERDSVLIKRMPWGIFDVVSVDAFSQHHHFSKAVQYGFPPKSSDKTALYLADLNRPLSLCGKTTIKGDCYLPKAGAKRAYIEGKSYVGKQLLYGKQQDSKPELPPLNKTWLSSIKDGLNGNFPFPTKPFNLDAEEENTKFSQSFLDTTCLINGISEIADSISGNFIVHSSRPVFIDKQASLEHLIVFAPGIIVEDGFKGNLQLFATDSILIGKDVLLEYPSVAGLLKTTTTETQPFIRLGENSQLQGIAFTQQDAYDRMRTKLSIGSKAIVHGQVYTDGFLELKGSVYGKVECAKFTLRTPSSIYENHLLDAVIDQSKRSSKFVGSSLMASEQHKEIVQWLP